MPLAGAVEAAGRIVEAVRSGRTIVIYGDYDVNGVCGTSILWSCLKLAGARAVSYYIPHRVEEGYGVNAEALRRLADENPSALIVTVDCGISAFREAELARELGVELIVTDHHTIGDGLPPASVVVHPRRPDGCYPCGDLCGAGVAFKLAWEICKSFGDGKRASPHLRDFLVRAMGLVALATIADVVPLSDENRIMVRHGLAGIVGEPMVGMRALMEVSGCLAKKRLNTGTVGFILAPRINAAGRLERAMMAVEMLTTEDAVRARQIALELDRCNARRQEIERKIHDEARAMVDEAGGVADRRSIVVGRPGWHPGVIGIVAGRLAEQYHRPTVVLAQGEAIAQGSARSIAGFDLYEAIKDCSAPLVSFGGHAAAAGLKIACVDIEAFSRSFEERCRSARCARAPGTRPGPRRRGPARGALPPRGRGTRAARALWHRQSQAPARGRPARGGRHAPDRRGAQEPPPAPRPAGQRRHEGHRLEPGRTRQVPRPGHPLLPRVPPHRQRVEQPSRDPARDQGLRAGYPGGARERRTAPAAIPTA